jgi:hypothetical protein
MDRFFKMFSKGLSGKKEEPKKEEEDPMFDVNLNFEVTQMKPNEILNSLIKDVKIGGQQMESYENYNLSLDKLLSQFNEEASELDYRYKKIIEKSDMMEVDTGKK